MTAVLYSTELYVWLPRAFWPAVCLLAAWFYYRRGQTDLRKIAWRLIWAALFFYVIYALWLSFGQYDLWSRSDFTRAFIESPLPQDTPLPEILRKTNIFESDLGYFLFYVFGRFWLEQILGVLCAFAFYFFLRFLRKYRDRFFEEGEPELGLLSALVAGWPGIVAFLIFAFPGVILVSIFRRIFLKEELTTLGWPFILAALATFLLWKPFLTLLGLRVLFI